MSQIVTRGLVIREQPFREQDKILTVMTEAEGKQKVIVKGVRRSKSTLTAATQLFAYGEFVLFPGKNFATLNSASLIESFYPLRQDMVKMALGSYILELLDALFQVDQGNAALLKVALYFLYYLSENMVSDDRILIAAFQLKAAEAQGVCPVLEHCVYCRHEDELIYFNVESGGAVCRECSGEHGHTYRLLPEQLDMMRILLTTPAKKLRKMDIPEAILVRIMDIMDHYLSYNLEKKLSAYRFYKSLCATL